MSNKKSSKRNPYTPTSIAREQKKEQRAQKSRRNRMIAIASVIAAAVLLIGAILAISIVNSIKNSPSARVEKAEEYLKDNIYKVVMSSGVDSTDDELKAALNAKDTTVTLSIDGDFFKAVIPHGEANITYLYHNRIMYIDESVINVKSKQLVTDEALIKSLREEYIDQYITVFSPDGFRDYDREVDDSGNETYILTDLTKEERESFERALANIAGGNSGAVVSIDDDETGARLVFDSEGRYKTVEQTYALTVTYPDGYKALITMDAKKEYTYGDGARVKAPAGNYLDMSGDLKNIFASSFGVTTEISTKYDNKDILDRLSSIGLTSSLRVDGNNYEIKSLDGTMVYTLVGDKLYLFHQVVPGEVNVDNTLREYDVLDDGKRGYFYYNHVISNVFPENARDYVDIKTSTVGGVTTVTCSTITEDYYDYVNKLINTLYTAGYSSLQLTPDADSCTYTVKYDSEGRFLSTEIVFVVQPTDMSGLKVYDKYELKVTRTFDYEAAKSYYENAEEGAEPWVSTPENDDEYQRSELY